MVVDHTLSAIRDQWRKNKFRGADFLLTEACKSILDNKPVVVPIEIAGRWMYCDKVTNEPAIFTYAMEWYSNYNLATGNFVAPGCEPPVDCPRSAAISEFGLRTEIQYSFETTNDKAIFHHMETLEDLLKKQPNFNPLARSRTTWQRNQFSRYSISHKFFNLCNERFFTPTPEKDLAAIHPWLAEGARQLRAEKGLKFNSNLPSYLEYQDGKFVPIEDCDPPSFMPGDIVWLSFHVGYYISAKNWAPDVIPLELVRIARGDSSGTSRSADSNEWPPFGKRVDLLVGGAVAHPITTSAGELSDTDSTLSDDDRSSQHSASSILRRREEAKNLSNKEEMTALPDGEDTTSADTPLNKTRNGKRKNKVK